MKRYLTLFTGLLLVSAAPQWANSPDLTAVEEPEELIIYNRILAKVNGKTISVIDVMKKMDLFLQSRYPEYVNSKVARFQFYSNQWPSTLAQMIDQELMLADAEHLELKVTDAEVREEMLNRFGPSIMASLDKMNMGYEEARKMVHSEMIVQRMQWIRVNSKAFNQVHPNEIKEAYKQYCVKNPAVEEWEYQVLSLRSANKILSEELAKRAFDLVHTAHSDLAAAADQIKKDATEENPVTITLSPVLKADEKNIAQAHREVLAKLNVGTFSEPIAQVSRVDNTIVQRIFFLKEHTKKEVPAFEKMAEDLKSDLLEEAASKEGDQYIAKLRQRMSFDEKHMVESLPPDFKPFALR